MAKEKTTKSQLTKPAKKTKVVKKTVSVKEEKPISLSTSSENVSTKKSKFLSLKNRRFVAILVVLAALAFIYFNRSLFLAATVNGKPITTAEVNQRLNTLYKEKVLSQIVNEKIIEQEASKKGISVTSDQINAKVEETEKSFGGKESFEALLTQQGVTRDEFARQIKLQLMVENLYRNEANPSEDEIKKFMEENKSLPEATDAAKFRETAKQAITQQKLSEVFNQKFPELKQKADVKIF